MNLENFSVLLLNLLLLCLLFGPISLTVFLAGKSKKQVDKNLKSWQWKEFGKWLIFGLLAAFPAVLTSALNFIFAKSSDLMFHPYLAGFWPSLFCLSLGIWLFFKFTKKEKISRPSLVAKLLIFLIFLYAGFLFTGFNLWLNPQFTREYMGGGKSYCLLTEERLVIPLSGVYQKKWGNMVFEKQDGPDCEKDRSKNEGRRLGH